MPLLTAPALASKRHQFAHERRLETSHGDIQIVRQDVPGHDCHPKATRCEMCSGGDLPGLDSTARDEAGAGACSLNELRQTVVGSIATMAKLHGQDRYNRSTHDVENITGHPAQTVRQYVEQHRDLFS